MSAKKQSKPAEPTAAREQAAEPAQAGSAPSEAVVETALYGSSTQPARVKMDGTEVALGDAVRAAFLQSGLSIAEWNALEADEREGWIAMVIDVTPNVGIEPKLLAAEDAPAAEPESEPVASPISPETVAQQVLRLQQEQAAERERAETPRLPVDVQSLFAEMTPAGQLVVGRLLEYARAMRPTITVGDEDAGRHQIVLYRTIVAIINRLDEDFQSAFTILLRYFHEERDGVFNERFVYRAFDTMPLPEGDRKVFQRLLNLVKATADVPARAFALKQINMTRTLEAGISEPGRQRILSYYNLG